jgi:hypothetical protein
VVGSPEPEVTEEPRVQGGGVGAVAVNAGATIAPHTYGEVIAVASTSLAKALCWLITLTLIAVSLSHPLSLTALIVQCIFIASTIAPLGSTLQRVTYYYVVLNKSS